MTNEFVKAQTVLDEVRKIAHVIENDDFAVSVDDSTYVTGGGLIGEIRPGYDELLLLHYPEGTYPQGPGWETHPTDGNMYRHVKHGLLLHNDTVYIDSCRTFVIVDFGLGATYGFTKSTMTNDPATTVNADRLFNAYKTYLTETYAGADDPLLEYTIGHFDCRLWG